MGKKKPSRLREILDRLNNRYILVTLGFLVWMTFFDKNDFLTTYSYRSTLNQLRDQTSLYEQEIKQNKAYMNDLKSDSAHLERFARETYLMKKPDEDIFVIVK